MNAKQIDYVPKEHREYFKKRMLEISLFLEIKFKGDKAFYNYPIPYNFTEQDLSIASKVKKEINEFLNEFRHWQFKYDYSKKGE